MPRAYLSGRKLLLLFVFAAIGIGGAWWWQRPPPEPVFQGTRLSEYLVEDFKRDGDARPLDDQLKSYGPTGVAWLAYKLEHGRRPFTKNGPLPLDNAPDWLRRWF